MQDVIEAGDKEYAGSHLHDWRIVAQGLVRGVRALDHGGIKRGQWRTVMILLASQLSSGARVDAKLVGRVTGNISIGQVGEVALLLPSDQLLIDLPVSQTRLIET